MKKIVTKFGLALTATFFAGAVMAQVDTTTTPEDTTAAVPTDTTPVTPPSVDTTVSVPDTTSPNAQIQIDNASTVASLLIHHASNNFYITNKEFLNRQNDIKTEETEA